MVIVSGEIKKEWVVLFALNKVHRLLDKHIGHVFVDETRFVPARHGSNTADTIDDGSGMLFVGLNL